MAESNSFMHLPLPLKTNGKAFYRRPNIPPIEQTKQNQANRRNHGEYLKRSATDLSKFWNKRRSERVQQNLPVIEGGIPFLLQIDPLTDINFLYGMGFEVVCDLDDGFIVVASDDVDLKDLQQNIDNFICNKPRSGSPAKVYGLCDDENRLSRILSKSLYDKWAELGTSEYIVDVSIECNGLTRNPELPQKEEGEADTLYDERCSRAKIEYYMAIDDIARKRQQEFENIVNAYNSNQGYEYIDDIDSFSVRISINGNGLRDLVQNFGYIFEVTESAEIIMETATGVVAQESAEPVIIGPSDDSPIICIIDSGIQENHRYISPAILSDESICLIKDEESTNDEYGYNSDSGGHGTRVAGAVLFHNNIPDSGEYRLPCFIRNVRVLNKDNHLPMDSNPPQIIANVIQQFASRAPKKSKIFNHSIGEGLPFDGEQFRHMSIWAAKIDAVSYENDVLFI